MELKATRSNLLAALYWTQSIVERRNTMPILANVLIECQKGNIRYRYRPGSWREGELDGDVVKEGTVTVNAKNSMKSLGSSDGAGSS
jgi:DNA polymerase III sliding clamp (beta) subunit (PCNA family)